MSSSRELTFQATFDRGIFEGCCDAGTLVSSRKHNLAGREWWLRLYPSGYKEPTHVSCFVACESNLFTEASIKLSLVNSKGDNFTKTLSAKTFDGKSQGFYDYISIKTLRDINNGYIVNDKVDFNVILKLCNTSYVQTLPSVSISNELSKLLFDQTLSDAKIKVYNEVIPIHKIVLYSHSEVFRAMFTSNMLEATTSTIEITDFEANIVKEFLRYLYTGACSVNAIENHCEELLAISCKYQVEGLIVTCTNHMITNLSLENVRKSLCIADKFGTKSLKQASLDFISNHAKILINKEGFLFGLQHDLWQDAMKAIVGVDMNGTIDLPVN